MQAKKVHVCVHVRVRDRRVTVDSHCFITSEGSICLCIKIANMAKFNSTLTFLVLQYLVYQYTHGADSWDLLLAVNDSQDLIEQITFVQTLVSVSSFLVFYNVHRSTE